LRDLAQLKLFLTLHHRKAGLEVLLPEQIGFIRRLPGKCEIMSP
jgi:hypothetical protein